VSHDEAARVQGRFERLLSAGAAILSEHTLTQVLQRVADLAREVLDARYSALGVLDQDGASLAEFVTSGLSAAERARIGNTPRGHGLLGLVIREGKPIRTRDIGAHPPRYGFPPHHPPMMSFLGVPIVARAELGAATLTRFYAFHVLWLPLLLSILVLLHIVIVIRQGIAPLPRALEQGAPARTSDPAYPAYYREAYAATKRGGQRFWPDILGKDAIVALGVVAAIVLLAARFGAPLEAPADPTDTAYVPRPEWYFLPVYELLKHVPGSLESLVAVGVPTALVVVLLALPLFDRHSTRNLRHRPVALLCLTALLGGSAFLIGAAARGAGSGEAGEVGRPLTSVERAGRAFYQSQQCAGCHRITGQGGEEGPDLTEVGLRHSAGWLHSFMEEPSRFHSESRMPAYGPPALTHQEIEELARYLTSLRGRAGPEVQPQFYDTFPPPPSPPQPLRGLRGPQRSQELGDRCDLLRRQLFLERLHVAADAVAHDDHQRVIRARGDEGGIHGREVLVLRQHALRWRTGRAVARLAVLSIQSGAVRR